MTNSQVQLGDLISLLKDTNAGGTMMGLDNILGRMFKKLKKAVSSYKVNTWLKTTRLKLQTL